MHLFPSPFYPFPRGRIGLTKPGAAGEVSAMRVPVASAGDSKPEPLVVDRARGSNNGSNTV